MGMSRKRRNGCPLEIRNDGPRICVDKNDIHELTKLARSWDFTCSFCFKKFPSAQAMGGHQNAHRTERLEEKRLFVRDPIGYRKRAYLRAKAGRNFTIELPPNPALNLHAATIMLKHELANIHLRPPKLVPVGGFGEFNVGNNSFSNTSKDSRVGNIKNNGGNLKNQTCGVMNFLGPKELSLVESVGRGNAADAEGMEFNISACEMKLDLTLKL
ncbi:UNVERIFIED_CONTAM: Zinc finger protein GIS2 [Sesamum indicum]